MTAIQFLTLAGIGAVASGVNTVAGGGSLLSYPALNIGFRMASRTANATNSVGLWPGSLAGALGYVNLIKRTGKYLKSLALPTLIGSQLGAVLLLETSNRLFDQLVPVLILLAAFLMLFQKQIRKACLKSQVKISVGFGMFLQFLVSVYGGYFGAGMGIMMLAIFGLFIEGDIHELNAVKNWLGLLINFSITFTFALKGLVDYSIAMPLIIGSVVGGYGSARLSQKVDPEKVRLVVIVYSFAAAGYFIYQQIHH